MVMVVRVFVAFRLHLLLLVGEEEVEGVAEDVAIERVDPEGELLLGGSLEGVLLVIANDHGGTFAHRRLDGAFVRILKLERVAALRGGR